MSTSPSVKRLVVKVGTSTLTYDTGHLHLKRIDELVRVLSDIKNSGCDVVLVSSGAIAVGSIRLGLTVREVRLKQAAAAVGQCQLIHLYDKLFAEYGIPVGQILLTRDDVSSERPRANLKSTFSALRELGALPIVNENDSVAFDEIERNGDEQRFFGDNDTLSAEVAELVDADLLVLLTDIDALYDSDPRQNPGARPIPKVRHIDARLFSAAGGAGTKRGTGGMISKLHAARTAMAADVPMIIASGQKPSLLYDIMAGKPVGTLFAAD